MRKRTSLGWGWGSSRTSWFDGRTFSTQQIGLSILSCKFHFEGQTLQSSSSRLFLAFSRLKKKSENSGLAPFPLLQASEDRDGSPEGGSGSLCSPLRAQGVEDMVQVLSLSLGPQSPALGFPFPSRVPGLPPPHFST